jgi:tungstate transport system ATP-binding protein
MKDKTPILEARAIQVIRGGAVILDTSSLCIEAGETLSLIGPNGAGKSTLLMALSRLIKISQGEIIFKGQHVGSNQSALEYRRKLAMVFQEPLLFNTTVFGNVVSGLKIRRTGGEEARRIVEYQLERLDRKSVV